MDISKDLLTNMSLIIGMVIAVGTVFNGIVFAIIHSKYVPRSYLFCPKNGTPIYRTIEDCKEMEEELKKERRERDERIEKTMQAKVDSIEATNKEFIKSMKALFDTQTKQISEVVKSAVNA